MERAIEDDLGVLCRVEGRVQGVGFRWSTAERARRQGLRGWVRNDPDGSVRVFVQGPPSAVRSFLQWLEQGPSSARVDQVVRRLVQTDPHLPETFEIRR